MISEGGRKDLEERVDELNPIITAKAAAFAKTLGSFGFKGEVSIALSVSVNNKFNGVQEAVVERKMNLSFDRE